MARAEGLRVEVVVGVSPRVVEAVCLTLPPGSTALQALQASGLVQQHGLDLTELRLAVWSRECGPDTPVRDRDRVELVRALSVDPKEARRQRYKRQLSDTRKR
jgi:putative ubiquitin-RnfH superfamily antitoxin RatB of RatAB toxin-antitoxin module